ncbi:enoyl-CoA hydratase/isomerase family protein [Frankia sp. AgB32]|uniref:enoyl-CoA hydratase/isomerase family protein n=1 Tax=Frankia sp. AgB32 TaxID=631119 RepID=UPI00200F0316|nr:enoyl-CoA hydratase-related protein [Frankia sp. AgB32]MCK9893501.1 enoyl-CoA hydratase-related protein [Frankia sp. AgB32]
MTVPSSDSVAERPAVGYALDGPVAWLTIDRPERRNALSAEVRAGLWAGLRRFRDDDGAAVLVLTGAGDKAFSAGGDLKEMAAETLRVPPPDWLPQLGRNIEIDKPVIAAVNGVAYAGGFLLAQYADLVVAAEHARFAITEVKVGRGTPWAAPLPYLLPPRVAMHLLLTGEPISARRACELGLVNEVVPADQLHAAAGDLARRIAANAPLSVRAAKKTVGLLARYPLEQALEVAERLWAPVYHSDDAQEGPRAFREGRPPVWKGH